MFTRVTACTLARSPEVIRYIEGFSYFVTSITAPIATGWSESCRVGLSPTEKRRLITAHAISGNRSARNERQVNPGSGHSLLVGGIRNRVINRTRNASAAHASAATVTMMPIMREVVYVFAWTGCVLGKLRKPLAILEAVGGHTGLPQSLALAPSAMSSTIRAGD